MIQEKFQEQMMAHGFLQVKTREGFPLLGTFTRMENPVLYCVCLVETEEIPKWFLAYTEELEKKLSHLQCTHLVKLVIHTQKDLEILPEKYSETTHSIHWWYDAKNGRIVPKKGDPSKLIGIEKLLLHAQEGGKVEKLEPSMSKEDKPFVCFHILGICILAFLAMLFLDETGFLIRSFGVKQSAILEGEIYRFVTAMFLHSGWLHLFSNSVMLYYFGTQMERILGHKKFLLTYLFCGLTCGLASILWKDVYSVGASGGLFGLMMLALLYTKKYGSLGRGRMNHATLCIFVIYGIAMGFTNTTTDNLGHLGGLLGGLLVYVILEKRKS